MSALQGRVFDRFRRFEALAEPLRRDVALLRPQLATDSAKTEIFKAAKQKAPGASSSLAYSASGKALLTAIQIKLEELRHASTDPSDSQENVTPEYAQQVAEALVLSGFITPSKEAAGVSAGNESFAFSDADTYVAVGTEIANDVKNVFTVRDGAIQAGNLKRKRAGLFVRFTGKSQSCYVVVNETTKSLFVFESDSARIPPVLTLDLSSGATVEFSATLEHGVKVTVGKASEIFGAESKDAAEAWLNAIINAGATYREAFNVDTEAVKSIYELKDYDMQGNEVSMEKYKGKVLLVVNVSSLCGLTPTNYPELAELDKKYRDQGLEILAFPCNQFSNQEPGTHEEIMEFVKKYNCEFPFFEKHDVNGASARPVFTYLKAKLPGSFGNFVKWNFTKFLVDRNGQPYKRFAPKDLPFSFEDDIKALLEQKPDASSVAAETNHANGDATEEEKPPAEAAATSEEAQAAAAETEAATPAAETADAANEREAATPEGANGTTTEAPAATQDE
uniref:Glutathione peroxidase n=1 Tax=Globisporangium ultimum (strain ATCC 200006 / CBS 805.95 / DAOM BR144) TaxID=431595 RepID=K3WJ83_GLOUD